MVIQSEDSIDVEPVKVYYWPGKTNSSVCYSICIGRVSSTRSNKENVRTVAVVAVSCYDRELRMLSRIDRLLLAFSKALSSLLGWWDKDMSLALSLLSSIAMLSNGHVDDVFSERLNYSKSGEPSACLVCPISSLLSSASSRLWS